MKGGRCRCRCLIIRQDVLERTLAMLRFCFFSLKSIVALSQMFSLAELPPIIDLLGSTMNETDRLFLLRLQTSDVYRRRPLATVTDCRAAHCGEVMESEKDELRCDDRQTVEVRGVGRWTTHQ